VAQENCTATAAAIAMPVPGERACHYRPGQMPMQPLRERPVVPTSSTPEVAVCNIGVKFRMDTRCIATSLNEHTADGGPRCE